jgi:hypothetical protein
MRVCGWTSVLAARLEAAQSQPFAWGCHDCATWAFDLRRDLTGGPDHAARWRGRYRTARGAYRVMRRLGWESLEGLGRDLLGDPLATPLLAQRGDLVLGGEDPAFGICTGARAAFVAPKGLTQLPLASCSLVWRV